MAMVDHNLGFRQMVDLILHRSVHTVSDEIKLGTEMLYKQLVHRKLYQASRLIENCSLSYINIRHSFALTKDDVLDRCLTTILALGRWSI